MLLALPAAAGAPEAAVERALARMKASLRAAPDAPSPRGPHEWNARRVLAAGTVNGCVEAAKAFLALLREEDRSVKAAYVDAFNPNGPGGHAVVEVLGSDGRYFIVDAAAFEKLPASAAVDEAALAAPVEIRKDRRGRVVQFGGRGDVYLHKAGSQYLMTVYPAGQVFDGPRESERSFSTLKELNQALAGFLSSRALIDRGLILPFADDRRSAFFYPDPAGGLARYVVYGRFPEPPDPDDAERREPAARRAHLIQ